MSNATQNYFELFGLPIAYDVDQSKLAEHYRELQRAVHPDKFASASDQDRRLSVQRAALINEAFQTLKSPIRRARYMLEMRGMEFDDQRETAIEPAFLMEQMELRESLAEIPRSDAGLMELGRLQDNIQARLRQLIGELVELFKDNSDVAMTQAKANMHKLQFMDKLQQETENVEQDIADAL